MAPLLAAGAVPLSLKFGMASGAASAALADQMIGFHDHAGNLDHGDLASFSVAAAPAMIGPGVVRNRTGCGTGARVVTAFMPNLREQIFKEGNVGSAEDWGNELNKLQSKCFEEPEDPESCKQVADELTKAGSLFTELSLSAKATATGALARIGAPLPDVLKTADVGLPGVLLLTSCVVATSRNFPTLCEQEEQQRPRPQSIQDFL